MSPENKSLSVEVAFPMAKWSPQIELANEMGLTKDEAIFILAAIVQRFSFECLSGDLQALVMYQAEAISVEAGIEKEKARSAIQRLGKYMEKTRKSNMISQMF